MVEKLEVWLTAYLWAFSASFVCDLTVFLIEVEPMLLDCTI